MFDVLRVLKIGITLYLFANKLAPGLKSVIVTEGNAFQSCGRRLRERKRELEQRARRGLPQFKSLLLAIKKQKRYDFVVLVEGSPPEGFKEIEKELNMLERANLIKGEMKFTDRDAYRRYVLTKKGDDLAESLLKEE